MDRPSQNSNEAANLERAESSNSLKRRSGLAESDCEEQISKMRKLNAESSQLLVRSCISDTDCQMKPCPGSASKSETAVSSEPERELDVRESQEFILEFMAAYYKKRQDMDGYIEVLETQARRGCHRAVLEIARLFNGGAEDSAGWLKSAKAMRVLRVQNVRSLLEQQVARGDVQSMYELGVLFDNRSQHRKALQLFEMAALQNHAKACFQLANYYDHGMVVATNREIALKLYRQASKHGLPEAIFKVGVMHHKGRGGASQNFEKAVKYYQRAAQLGQVNALYNLGNSYLRGQMDGKNFEQDISRAISYLQQAANKSHYKALYHLGRLHLTGFGVPRSLKRAEMYLEEAVNKKCFEAIEPLKQVKTEFQAHRECRAAGCPGIRGRARTHISLLFYLLLLIFRSQNVR